MNFFGEVTGVSISCDLGSGWRRFEETNPVQAGRRHVKRHCHTGVICGLDVNNASPKMKMRLLKKGAAAPVACNLAGNGSKGSVLVSLIADAGVHSFASGYKWMIP
jgi:hypothetical protein